MEFGGGSIVRHVRAGYDAAGVDWTDAGAYFYGQFCYAMDGYG